MDSDSSYRCIRRWDSRGRLIRKIRFFHEYDDVEKPIYDDRLVAVARRTPSISRLAPAAIFFRTGRVRGHPVHTLIHDRTRLRGDRRRVLLVRATDPASNAVRFFGSDKKKK